MSTAAVITGDLIASRSADAAVTAAAMQDLARAAKNIGAALGADLHFTRFRGDGWQVVLHRPGDALLACLWLHGALRVAGNTLDSRMSVGIGSADLPADGNLSAAHGTAFEISGTGLDTIGKRWLTVAGQGIRPTDAALFDLAAHIIAGWTAPQAEATLLALSDTTRTQKDIAAKLGITRQAVQLRLAGAGHAPLSTAIAAFRALDFTGTTP